MTKHSNSLTLREVIKIEPEVGGLIRSARRKTKDCALCRMGLNRRQSNQPGYKQRIAEIVGWTSVFTDGRLRTMHVYDLVYRAVWDALPEVKNCARCGWFDEDVEQVENVVRAPLAHLRSAVWQKTDGHCHYCRKKLDPFVDFHIDHVIAKSRGGMDIIENLVPACATCNLSKGAKLVNEWERSQQ